MNLTTFKIAAANGTVIAIIRLPDVRDGVTIVLGIVTLAFTLWQWRREANKKK